MLKKLLLLSILLSILALSAQPPTLEYLNAYGGSGIDAATSSALDDQGNLYVVGHYSDTVDFDQGPPMDVKMATPGFREIYLQKLDASGNHLWVKTFPAMGHSYINKMIRGNDGSIYLAGRFEADSMDFDPDPLQTFYLKRGNYAKSLFIVKLSATGMFKWAIAQSCADVNYTGLVLDTLGNLYTTGEFGSPIDKNPHPVSTSIANPFGAGKYDFFIQKLDTAGNQAWFQVIGGVDDVKSRGIVVSQSQDPVIIGYFKGSVDFDPGWGSVIENPTRNEFKGFILRLNSSGNFISVKRTGGAGTVRYLDVTMGDADNLHISGTFLQLPDFDPGPGVVNVTSTNLGVFIQKISLTGVVKYVNAFSCNPNSLHSEEFVNSTIDSEGHDIIAAGIVGGVNLEPGKPNGKTFPSASGWTGLIMAKYDSSGTLLWGHGLFATPFPGSYTRAVSPNEVISNDLGEIYIPGFFWGTVGFDPYSLAATRNSRGSNDCFILKFGTCAPQRDTTLLISSCKNYELTPGYFIYKDTTLVDTISLSTYCDSVVTTKIDVFNLPTSFSYINGTLSWDSVGTSSYYFNWINCDSGTYVQSAKSSIFKPIVNGNYALSVSNGPCTDTSACFTVNNVGLKELNPLEFLTVYPNPVNEVLNISCAEDEVYDVTLSDISGRKVLEAKKATSIDVSQLPAGTYFLRIEKGEYSVVRKVVRQ